MPKYTLKKLPLPNEFNTLEIVNMSIRANDALSELDKAILDIPNYELILQPLTIREAVASSEIENIRTTTFEILQAELLQPRTLPSAQKEVIHYKKSLLHGLDIVQKSGKIDIENLIDIHCGIVPDKIGLRNRSGVYAGNRLGEVIYTPPQSLGQINDYLENLFEFLYSETYNPLVKIIICHYQFEAIHPFFDGNGRVGRILMALQFCLEKKLRYPILFTSGYISKNKVIYYELFRQIQDNDNWNDWVIFHLNGIINQARECLLRVNEIKQLKSSISSVVINKIKIPKRLQTQLIEYLFSKAFYTQTDMSKNLNISRNTAKKYLEELTRIKLLDNRQAGRELLYFNQELLDILS